MLYFGFKDKDSKLLWWVGVVLVAAFGAYGLTRSLRKELPRLAPSP